MRHPTSLRLAILAMALCAIAATASAADPEGEKPAVPFIVETHVAAPRQVGEFGLVSSKYDPEQRFSGVSLRYQHPLHPAARIDLFVYPIGRTDTERALDSGMQDFSASLKPAVDGGYYRDVAFGETAEFDLEQSVDNPHLAPDATPTDSDDPLDRHVKARRAEAARTAAHLDGRRLSFRYDYSPDRDQVWIPQYSRTYLFVRHLHYFKLRVSADSADMDEARFFDVSDQAARALVPAVSAHNVGSCSDSAIDVGGDGTPDEMATRIIDGLLAAELRRAVENCHADADEAPIGDGLSVNVIRYRTNDWRSR